MANVVILGAGLAGLSTAYHLDKLGLDYKVCEKESRVGGLCRSEAVNGFTFDYTGHLLHFRDAYARSLVSKLLGDNLLRKERNSWIYSKGVYSRYPFQSNLRGLPFKTKSECLLGFLKAKGQKRKAKSQSFEEWIYSSFGKGIAKHFMIPYNHKLWRVDLSQITPEWTGRFVPQVTFGELLRSTVSERGVKKGYNPVFYYPKDGGIEALPAALASRLRRVCRKREAVRVDWRGKRVGFADGSKEGYSVLVSAIPLPELVERLTRAPAWVYERGKLLRWLGVATVNLGIERPSISDKHWVYVPEKALVFYRVGFPMNFSSSLVPEGRSSVYAEISYLQGTESLDRLASRVVEDLTEMGVLAVGEIVPVVKTLDLKYAYVLFDENYSESREEILDWLKSQNIFSTGRFGAWKYSTMEDAILDGRKVAEEIRAATGDLGKTHRRAHKRGGPRE